MDDIDSGHGLLNQKMVPSTGFEPVTFPMSRERATTAPTGHDIRNKEQDGGLDIIAHKDELGFEPPIIKVQVKSTNGSISNDVVQALYGQVDKAEFGLVVTLGTFSPSAKSFAKGKSNLRLIDRADLVDLIFEHYDKFDPRYKAVLPLKQVFVPAPLEE